jgi:hypothetical protein
MGKKNLIAISVFTLLLLVVGIAKAGYTGSINIQNVENLVLGSSGETEEVLGGQTRFSKINTEDGYQVDGTTVIDGSRAFAGTTLAVTGTTTLDKMLHKEAFVHLAPASEFATTTLTAALSGTTYYLSGKGNRIVLPAVANGGVNFRFVINGAFDTLDFTIASAEGDNIEGTLIVAGAVVDCDAEDFINFIADGENIGDYVEVRSDGTQWLIGDSGALTASKLTCTDPS